MAPNLRSRQKAHNPSYLRRSQRIASKKVPSQTQRRESRKPTRKVIQKPDRLKRTNAGLCDRCSELRFEEFLSTTSSPGFDHREILNLGGRGELNNNLSPECRFCRLLRDQWNLNSGQSIPKGFCISLNNFTRMEWVFPALKRFPSALGLCEHKIRLSPSIYDPSIDRIGLICCTNPPKSRRRNQNTTLRLIEPDSIDFTILRGWMHTCQAEHGVPCRQADAEPAPLLTLINCETRGVEAADGQTPYVALSYVWGPSELSNASSYGQSKVLENIPLTIQDAITVTENLGYNHLWVDRYCISESNEKEKHNQIKQMDRIYEGAEVTLVAAAGSDPNYGLPGVSKRLRVRQPHASIGKYRLVSTMSDPETIIRRSKWMSRAWTYQEAVCARRLLIFTDHQVYFECPSMNRCETIDSPKDRLYSNIFKYHRNDYHVYDHIYYYSRRDLTYENDALNGMLGIFRRLKNGRLPIYHFWGLPIHPESAAQERSTEGFLVGLSWIHGSGGQRRSDFPSWSWTGWACPVTWFSSRNYRITSVSNTPVKVYVWNPNEGNLDKRRVGFQEFYETLVKESSPVHLMREIHLKALTIELRPQFFENVIAIDNEGIFACPVGFQNAPGAAAYAPLHLLFKVEEGSRARWCADNPTLMGIFIGKKCYGNEHAFVMVVKQVPGGYERIGHISLWSDYMWCLDHDGLSIIEQWMKHEAGNRLESCAHWKPWFDEARVRGITLK